MRSRTLVSAGVVAGLVLTSGAVSLLPDAAPRAAAEALPAYASCDALLAHYRAELARTATPYGLGGGDMVTMQARASASGDESADSAAAPAAAAPTGTNLQEAGVDEPDTAKTAGGLLYAISERGLEILRTGPQPQLLGRYPLPEQAWGAELLVDGDRVLVLAPGYGAVGFGGDEPAIGRVAHPVSGRTSLLLLDVADPTEPRLVERLDLEGRYLSARLSGGEVRLVTSSVPDVRGVQPQEPYGPAVEAESLAANRGLARAVTVEDVLPTATRSGPGGTVLEAGPAVDCGQVRHATSPHGVSTLLVTTLDLSAGLAAQDRTGVTTDGELVYASADRLYVATSRWGTGPQPVDGSSVPAEPDGVTTELHGFDTTVAGRTTYAGTGSVPGYVLGRWALSSYDGHLRVAVTSAPPWNPQGQGQPSSSSVVVLAERGDGLVETGRVDGLGVTETIRAVRYFGDLATVVTFRQTDPLYVLDLADPAAPKLLGELKVPGFSTYLHPVGEDLLLGVGEEADETGQVTGMQVSLFDLSDRTRPTQVDRLQLGQVWSPALHDSRAFGYDAATRTALMSVSSWDGASAAVVGVRVQGRTLVEAGRLQDGPRLGGMPVERVLNDGTHLYAVSRTGVQAAALAGFTSTGTAHFGR